MNILIPDYIEDEYLEKINHISSDIKLLKFKIAVKKGILFFKDNFILKVDGRVVDDKLNNIDILIAPYYLTKEMSSFLLEKIPSIKWIHSTRTGVDSILIDKIKDNNIFITNTRICSNAISEFVLTLILSIIKKLHLHLRLQYESKWKFIASDSLKNKKAGVLGFGKIGKETAKILKNNGMKILVCDKVNMNDELLDKFFNIKDLNNFLRESDFIIITLPLTKETYHIINKENLKYIGKNSWIISIGRGDLIDGEALLNSLLKKEIGGVSLDLLDGYMEKRKELLSKLDNLILTHHSSFYYEGYEKDIIDVFINELKLFLKKEPLNNLIDISRGY